MGNTRTKEEEYGLGKRLILMTIAAAVGLVIVLVLLFGCAILTSAGKLPESNIATVTTVTCFVGAVLSGFLAARAVGKQALVTGLVTGLLFFLLLALLGALFLDGLVPERDVVPKLLSGIVGAVGGSVTAALRR